MYLMKIKFSYEYVAFLDESNKLDLKFRFEFGTKISHKSQRT